MADHTAVPDALRGTGAGLAMVKQMLTDARAERVTVIPLCPFVTVQAKRNFEWVDGFSG